MYSGSAKTATTKRRKSERERTKKLRKYYLYVTDMIVDLEGEVASIVLWIDWYLVVFALVIDH